MNKIVIIDDDDTSNYITELMIKSVDSTCEIKCFSNPKIVLDQIKELGIDKETIILLDLNMTDMNGWEFLDIFERSGTGCKYVILLASSDINESEKIKKYPTIKYFFIKPFSICNLKSFMNLGI